MTIFSVHVVNFKMLEVVQVNLHGEADLSLCAPERLIRKHDCFSSLVIFRNIPLGKNQWRRTHRFVNKRRQGSVKNRLSSALY